MYEYIDNGWVMFPKFAYFLWFIWWDDEKTLVKAFLSCGVVVGWSYLNESGKDQIKAIGPICLMS